MCVDLEIDGRQGCCRFRIARVLRPYTVVSLRSPVQVIWGQARQFIRFSRRDILFKLYCMNLCQLLGKGALEQYME